MTYTAFIGIERGSKIRAIKDIKTANRVMKKGDVGVVCHRWPYLLEVVPSGKNLPVKTTDVTAVELLSENQI